MNLITHSGRWERALQTRRVAWSLIAVAVLVVYLPSLDHAFQYDDLHSIIENPHLRSLANVDDFFWRPDMFTADPKSAMYRPLVLVSYALNHALGGYRVEGYHVFNIAVHLVNCLLVHGLVCRFFGSGYVALAGGLLFAMHPISSEPVNYISSRSESLCALFSLLSLTLYVRARERAQLGAYLGSVLAFACALLAKSIGLVLPLALVVRDYTAGASSIRRVVDSSKYYLAFALVGVAYIAAVGQALQTALVDRPVRGLWVQLATQSKVLVYYLKLLLVPLGQNVEHQMSLVRGLGDVSLWTALALLGSLAYCLILLWRYSRELLFWVVWPSLFLLPTYIVPLNVLANEHRLYIPAMGMAILTGWVLTVVVGRQRGLILFFLLILVYGSLSMQRSEIWRTPETLWTDAVEKAPQMPRPHLYLGNVHKEQGRNQEALGAYRRALTVNPQILSGGDLLSIYNNMGAVYLALGDNESAVQWYRRAIDLDPEYTKARDALEGLAAIMGNEWQPAAERSYKEALKWLVAGRPDLAIEQLQQGLVIQQHPKLYQVLGLAYERSGDRIGAIEAYRTVLRLPGVSANMVQGARVQLAKLQVGESAND